MTEIVLPAGGWPSSSPVLVPDDDDGAEIQVAGVVRAVADGQAEIDLTVTCGGEKVLAMARATVPTTA